MRFKAIGRRVRRILEGYIQEYGADSEDVLKGRVLLSVQDGREEIFATNEEVLDVLRRMKRDPYFAGLYLGEVKRGKFYLGLEGGTMLSKLAGRTITVGKKTEQLVLYGRDVFINSILKYSRPLKNGDACLILNEKGEFLAVGRFKSGIVENILDRGWYLRKGL